MTGHANQNDIEQLEHLQSRINRDPTEYSTLVKLGAMMFEPFHRPEESVHLLRKALELSPGNVDARFWLAECLFHDVADYEEAKVVLEEALEIDPNRSDCLSLLASVMADLGSPLVERLNLLRMAVQISPDWVTPRQQLAQAYIEMMNLEEAEIEARTALSQLIAPTQLQDSLEEYYESVVTGKTSPIAAKELQNLLEHIQALKKHHLPEAAKKKSEGSADNGRL